VECAHDIGRRTTLVEAYLSRGAVRVSNAGIGSVV
jgi:hypothetical protein